MSDVSAIPNLVFGLDAKVVAVAIVIISYVILFTEKVNRAIVALLGASIMIFAGILTQQTALKGIDFNTLALLIGPLSAFPKNRECSNTLPYGLPRKFMPTPEVC